LFKNEIMINISMIESFSQWFLSTNDSGILGLFNTWVLIMLCSAILCFIISEITRNFSQVDKLWSIMPIIYALVVVLKYPYSERLWIMFALVSIWGLRLSYNFYRKGGYNIILWRGEEDYRWSYLRENTILNNNFKFSVFNLFFISIYQHLLIMLFSTPILLAAIYPYATLNYLDYFAALLMLIFILIETIADNQQYSFHKLKKGADEMYEQYTYSLSKGFLQEGLWKYSRHPNFAAEQLIWITFYLFGVAASGNWLNWTFTGAALLVLLFIGSSWLTEKISSSKYPVYKEYQKTVPRFLPIKLRK
ncbi:MAG: DUF1295 domain-containing protein, partial [Bacteroidales bacterium]|nr:DUF1295 domain-containing protein [Bacteroidales bacterium]